MLAELHVFKYYVAARKIALYTLLSLFFFKVWYKCFSDDLLTLIFFAKFSCDVSFDKCSFTNTSVTN